MLLDLTDDQAALRETVAGLCRGRFPMEIVRSAEHNGLDRGRWRQLADAGVFSMCLPEERHGAGLHTVDAVVVFEELGRALVPGPLVATHLAADLIPGSSDGDVVGVVDRASGAVFVEHFGDLDYLIVLEPDHVGALSASRIRDLDATRADRPLDPLTPVWRIEALPASLAIGDAAELDRWHRDGTLLTAALAAGVAAAATDLTGAFALEREQFGRVIGSFQAVKHLLADMAVRAEMALTAVEVAGAAVDQLGAADGRASVAGAAIVASGAARRNGHDSVQIHGGLGYTWEVGAHLFLKRALVLEQQFASSADLALELGRGIPTRELRL